MTSIYDVEVKCEECGAVEQPERPRNWLKWIAGMALVFAGIGFFIGSVIGIATAGVGIVAWVVTLPMGLYIGYKIGDFGAEFRDGPTCPACGAEHSTGWLPFV